MFSKGSNNDGLEFLSTQMQAKDVWEGGELNMDIDPEELVPVGWLVVGADLSDDGEIEDFRFLTLCQEGRPCGQVLPVFDTEREAEAYVLATASSPFAPCGGHWAVIQSSALGLLQGLLENAEIEKVAWNPDACTGGARCSSAVEVIDAIAAGLGELGNEAA